MYVCVCVLNFVFTKQEASDAWTEFASPAASPPVMGEGPAMGPVNLGPSPTNESLPPLAIVLDAEALHRGMATRLASRGFPLAGSRGRMGREGGGKGRKGRKIK